MRSTLNPCPTKQVLLPWFTDLWSSATKNRKKTPQFTRVQYATTPNRPCKRAAAAERNCKRRKILPVINDGIQATERQTLGIRTCAQRAHNGFCTSTGGRTAQTNRTPLVHTLRTVRWRQGWREWAADLLYTRAKHTAHVATLVLDFRTRTRIPVPAVLPLGSVSEPRSGWPVHSLSQSKSNFKFSRSSSAIIITRRNSPLPKRDW